MMPEIEIKPKQTKLGPFKKPTENQGPYSQNIRKIMGPDAL